jgi:hypothetical protein
MPYKDPEARKAYARAHYLANQRRYFEQGQEARKAFRRTNQQYIRDYLGEHPCVDCGEADPVVLHFDHRDGADKVMHVSRMATRASLTRIIAEIEKCDVRCANCHMRRTAKQFGWWGIVGYVAPFHRGATGSAAPC